MRSTRLLAPAMVLLASCPGASKPVPTVRMSRVISIPVQLLTGETARRALEENPAALTLSRGAEDELPQGPESFAVLADGTVVISDPLRERLVSYDATGKYLGEQTLGFAASQVRLSEGTLEVRRATSDEVFRLGARGELEAVREAAARSVESERGQARLLGPGRGVIEAEALARRGLGPARLEVAFESETTRMISLQSLGRDNRGNTYVALETSRGAEAIEVVKLIRRYAPDGALVCQTEDVPLDYYVHPIDEFQVRDGFVYQLMPRENEVRIHVWDTNRPR